MKIGRAALILLATVLLPGTGRAVLSWKSSGPGGGGAFASPSVSAGGSVIVGSDLAGAYRSTNGGVSWSVIGINKGLHSTHVDAVVHHPSIDGTVFLGADNGIYRSTNCDTSPVGACTFSRTPLSALVTALGIASSGTASLTTVYAAGIDAWCDAGPHIWRSTDNGVSWTARAATGLPSNANIMAIRVQPGNANVIVAISAASRFTGCGQGSNFPDEAPNRAFISTNGGASFTPLVIPSTVPHLQQTEGASTWAYIEDVKFDKADSGKLWATVTANPSNTNYWAIDGELWLSTGSTGVGQAFQRQSIGHTGQIWPLTNGNLRVIDLRRQRPWDRGKHGVWQWSPASSSWARITTDAEYSAWTRGWSGTAVTYRGSLNGSLHTITPVNDSTLWWVDLQFAYRTNDGGHLFQQKFTAPSGSPVSYASTGIDNAVPAMLVPSPINNNIIYAGYLDMGCWLSNNARGVTPTWTDCNGPKSTTDPWPDSPWNGPWKGYGGNTIGIAPDPNIAGVLWAVHSPTNSGTGSYKVARSADSGVAWTDYSYNLGTLTGGRAITDLLVDAPTAATRVLWAIGGNGLYKLPWGQANWVLVVNPCNDGLMVFAKMGSVFLAGGSSGLCYSYDAGSTWMRSDLNGRSWYGPRADTLWSCSDRHVGVSDIAFDPTNSQNAWLTVVDPSRTESSTRGGLFKTTNGGASWTQVSSFAPAPFGRNFTRTVAVSPVDPNVVVVGTSTATTCGGYRIPQAGHSGIGAWVSRDGGVNWRLENSGLAWPFVTRMRFTEGAAPRLWALSPGMGVVYSAAPSSSDDPSAPNDDAPGPIGDPIDSPPG